MYKQFFGLRENPFNVNPDPRYLYLTAQTRGTLDELRYGIETRKGLMLLTGEVGTGKTTILNRLLDWLHQHNTPTAFVFNPHLETSHLFDFILADFEVPVDSRYKGNALMRLNHWLIERYRLGDNPVLIVDEAQGLPRHLLEEIRMLLNLETPREKLLQIVLAGQPEIEERLKQHDLRQLKQRITLRCKTAALSLEETHEYIQARLHIAGANGTPIFASEAMDAVHFYSGGIPRITNLLCEHGLINAYVGHVQPVPAHIIEEIASEFQLDPIKPLALEVDSEGEPGVAGIASQPMVEIALAPAPAPVEEAEPLLLEEPVILAAVDSPPYNVSDTLLSGASELASPVLDCEATTALAESKVVDVPVPVPCASEPERMEVREPSCTTAFDSGATVELSPALPMEQVLMSLSPFLNVVKPKDKSDHLPVSSRSQVFDPPKVALRPARVNTAKSAPVNSKRTRLPDPRISWANYGKRWKLYFLSAMPLLQWKQETTASLLRLKRSLQSVGAWTRRLPARRSRFQSFVSATQWRRSATLLYDWLRQPFDPMQLFRLPYAWLFKAGRKVSQTSNPKKAGRTLARRI
jgi:general secretion pathway protein A